MSPLRLGRQGGGTFFSSIAFQSTLAKKGCAFTYASAALRTATSSASVGPAPSRAAGLRSRRSEMRLQACNETYDET